MHWSCVANIASLCWMRLASTPECKQSVGRRWRCLLRIVWSGFRQLRKVRKGDSHQLPSAVRLAEGRDRRLRKVGQDAGLALVSWVRLRTCTLHLLLGLRRSVDCRSPSSLCFAGAAFCRLQHLKKLSVISHYFAPHCCAHCGLFFRAVGGWSEV